MSLRQTLADDWRVSHADDPQACTLQRQTTAKDASGGPLQTWASVAGQQDVPCDVQPASGQVRRRFAQLGLVVTYTVFLSRDVGARASDRFTVTTDAGATRTFLLVEGGYEAGECSGWPAAAHVEEVLGGP